jgi:SAM-dependent methyltransferase
MPAIAADQLLRYAASTRALRSLALPEGATLLDVGGFPGTFAAHLRAIAAPIAVTTADIADGPPDGYVRIEPGPLPFGDASFDAVVTNDTLEHVPPEARAAFLAELFRVARHGVVIAAPSLNPATAAIERMLDTLHRSLLSQPHPWLAEHIAFGLPDPALTLEAAARAGWPLAAAEANAPLLPWTIWQASHIARASSLAVDAAFAAWDAACAPLADAPAPPDAFPYRHVLCFARGTVEDSAAAAAVRAHATRRDGEAQRAEAAAQLFAAMLADRGGASAGERAAAVDARLRAALEDAEQRLRERPRSLWSRLLPGGARP